MYEHEFLSRAEVFDMYNGFKEGREMNEDEVCLRQLCTSKTKKKNHLDDLRKLPSDYPRCF